MPASDKRLQQLALLGGAFFIAICGLIYELLAGTLSSYLLGDSVYQFSLVIGLFMSSMGVGAWASRFIHKDLPAAFVRLQLLIGLFGGLVAPVLFFAFAVLDSYTPLLFAFVVLLGAMLGIEIPLIIRILKTHFTLRMNVSNVFTLDYIGALFAALLFPLVLVPQLGLMQTGFVTAMLNVLVGGLALYVFRHEIRAARRLGLVAAGVFLLLAAGFWQAGGYTRLMENRLYQDEIIHAQDTPYQRLIVTRRAERIRFYINGALQFDSFDEYRYHESLVHPAVGATHNPENVLILGGGDGLAARELLKYPGIERITLVDLDPAVTRLFSGNPLLRRLNRDSLNDPRVSIHNRDAWRFLEQSGQLYDLVVIDLPDPNNPGLSRLYSAAFYRLLKQHVSQAGVIVTQATSPLYSRKAFWCIEKTLGESTDGERWHTLPSHVYVPSFGEWGFVMASRVKPKPVLKTAARPLRYLDATTLRTLYLFPADMNAIDVEPNSLSSHRLLKYYQQGWEAWYE